MIKAKMSGDELEFSCDNADDVRELMSAGSGSNGATTSMRTARVKKAVKRAKRTTASGLAVTTRAPKKKRAGKPRPEVKRVWNKVRPLAQKLGMSPRDVRSEVSALMREGKSLTVACSEVQSKHKGKAKPK